MAHADQHEGVIVLDRPTCWRRLHEHEGEVGRVALTAESRIHIFPVNYAFESGVIVIRTGRGVLLRAAERNDPVGFEIDQVDVASRTGWNVSVSGRARVVVDRTLEVVLERLELNPFARGRSRHAIAIDVEQMSGREVARARS